ncbi:hypothetical protein ES332_A08G257600v1 [Gossypium tomentosum]|uniref:Uncharacterized protein n=1 Tax=Gossypium tomentosum TaxID=34277 RepID=A0A5D2PMW4_GOSTO|nr:hypothetical protein ES332_A08G257600v1 [Gossypium tomentosum]
MKPATCNLSSTTFQSQGMRYTIKHPQHKKVRNIYKLLPQNSDIVDNRSKYQSILLLRVQFLNSSQGVTL